MSEEGDRLADMARNRGLKLLRSRVRTPGKPGFGCYGLADASGDPIYGVRGKRALRASAKEIEEFLRGAETGRIRQYVMFIVVGTVAIFVLISFYMSSSLASP